MTPVGKPFNIMFFKDIKEYVVFCLRWLLSKKMDQCYSERIFVFLLFIFFEIPLQSVENELVLKLNLHSVSIS